MKKKIIPLIAGAFCLLQAHAQTQTVDLSTGSSGIIGANDPIWTVASMPNGTPADAIISNGSLSDNGVIYPNTYAHNACGNWISPTTITLPGPRFGTIPNNPGPTGNYDYRTTFTTTNTCTVSNAVINFTNAGADNTLSSIIVNGHVHAITGVGFNPLTALNLDVSADVVNGLNTIDVIVHNNSSYTGLMLCGNIIINFLPPLPVVTGASQFCYGDPITVSGASSGGLIQTYRWAIAECDAGGNVIVGGNSWNQGYIGTPGSFTFGSFIGFTPVCGHYYLITLTLTGPCSTKKASNTKLIYLQCHPTVNVTDPAMVCMGSDVTLSATGNSTSYTWGAPLNQNGSSVHVTATGSATYTVTGTLNGCTSTASVHVTAAPQLFDADLSTGVNNVTGAAGAIGFSDDTWKLRGTPGSISTAAFSSLNGLYMSYPFAGYSGGYGAWVGSNTERWITTQINSGYSPVVVPQTQSDNSPSYDNFYYFETQFNLPWNGYSNLRIELNDVAVDNAFLLFLNSGVLSGTPNNIEYQLYDGTWPESNFNTMHHPGTVGTNPSHYVVGTNTVIAQIMNGGGDMTCETCSYLGLLMNAHVKGECVASVGGGKSLQISDQDMIAERTEATTFVYPNPSAGTFTIRCEDQTILSIIVRNQLGQTVKTMEGVNASSAELSLDNTNKGFYFVEIRYSGQEKPVFKKVIIE